MGCCFLNYYNLPKKPDLVFFEYMINDLIAIDSKTLSFNEIARSVEGFVIRLKKYSPNSNICFINLADLRNVKRNYNNFKKLDIIYKAIANHYNIPLIDVVGYLENSNFDLNKLYENGIPHFTYPKGVKIVTDYIKNNLLKLFKQKNYTIYKHQKRDLDYTYENLNIYPIKPKMITGSYIESKFKNSRFDETYYSLTSSSNITFKISGELFGLYYITNAYSGYVKITVGDKSIIKNLCDKWGFKKPYIASRLLTPSLNLNNEKITLQLLNKIPENKSVNYSFLETKPINPPQTWILKIIGLIMDK